MGRSMLAIAAPLLVLGCSRKPPGESTAEPRPTASAQTVTAQEPRVSTPPAAIDGIARFDDCVLGHRGVLIDLGDPTSRADLATRADRGRVEPVERDGATWTRILARTVTVTFAATDAAVAAGADPDVMPVVEARVRGGVARSISLFLNGKPAGVLPLAKGETQVVSAKLTAAGTPNGAQLVSGTNELLLKMNASARSGSASDEQAEIDWIHIGPPDPDGAYGAPTRRDALISATIGGIPKRALALRAPGFARCSGFLPNGGRLTTWIALAGGVDADAEIRLLRDRTPAGVLASVHLGGADAKEWRAISIPLGDLGPGAKDVRANGGTLGALELVTTRAARGTRVLFGEPQIVASPAAAPKADAPRMPAARGVVLVVLGEAIARSIEPYGGKIAMPELTALAKSGVTFDANRATSGVASTALASMLTGLAPRAHGVTDEDASLPPDITTLADAARQAGIAAAMFTANPTTGAAFGFPRGWQMFVEKSPADDGGATRVFDEAAGWIDAHKGDRFFVVIHARGGHPPWDATPDELKSLAPADYAGGIDPKHAAELLAKARHVPPQIRLSDADRARAWALYALAMRAHDDALGRLVAAVRAAGLDDTTLFIVAGDAAVDEAAHVPFSDGSSLDEASLDVPLIVRPPLAAPKSDVARVSFPTTSMDVATSILDALDLRPPAAFQGADLWQIAGGNSPPRGRPLVASLGARFALRWSSFVLAGQHALSPLAPSEPGEARETKLCDLSLEPACVSDVRGAFPIALEALHRAAFDQLSAADHPRSPAVIDAKTASALKAWGR